METETREQTCLTTAEAAAYIAMSESWLRQRRMTGALEGQGAAPPFVRLGRSIRYLRSDLNKWLARHSRDYTGQGV